MKIFQRRIGILRVYSFSIEKRERECVCVFIDVIYSTRTTITTTAYPPNHRVTLVITSVTGKNNEFVEKNAIESAAFD